MTMREGTTQRRSTLIGLLAATLFLVCPTSAQADTGLPMIAVVWPPFWLLFIPVCVVEALIAKRVFALPLVQCAKLSLVANAWSTLVGIPLTWLALVLIEIAGGVAISVSGARPNSNWIILAPLGAPWLGPGIRPWHVPAAAAFLCIPFMFVSIQVERWSAAKRVSHQKARLWAYIANLATYLPIIAFLMALAVSERCRAP